MLFETGKVHVINAWGIDGHKLERVDRRTRLWSSTKRTFLETFYGGMLIVNIIMLSNYWPILCYHCHIILDSKKGSVCYLKLARYM